MTDFTFAVRTADCDSGWMVEEKEDGSRVIATYESEELAYQEIADNYLLAIERFTAELEQAIEDEECLSFFSENSVPSEPDIVIKVRFAYGGVETESGELFSLDGQHQLPHPHQASDSLSM